MSVGFALAVAEGLKYNGVPVSFEPGWETRGNGLKFSNGRPRGLSVHHTGDQYDRGLSTLIHGRSDLPGPLCNCCTYSSGRVHIIAAHPANHAGASGGKSMGPLPVTKQFNTVMWGNEIMFPGLQPWTPEQYRSARVLGGVVCGILGYSNPEYVRGHAETSITGKWDPGKGSGKAETFDMRVFRSEIWSALNHATAAKALEADVSVENIPLIGAGRIPLLYPVGSKADDGRKVWISASTLDLAGPGWVQVFAQGDTAGIEDWRWSEKELKQSEQNLLARPNRQLKDGVTKLIVSWDMRNAASGVLCIEARPTK